MLLSRPARFLNTHAYIGFTAISLLFVSIALVTASRRVLDIDELFVAREVMVPSSGELWAAMQTGAEKLPPPFIWLEREMVHFLGLTPLVLRLSAIAGFWLMCAVLFWVVKRYSSPVFGLIAMTFPMVLPPFFYATEARSYGLLLGFSALSALCWLSVETRRRAALIGLAFSLFAAVAFHYYGILLIIPLGIAEIFRSLQKRRIDIAVWLCFGTALIPLAIFFPLIRQARLYAGSFWAKPQFSDMIKLPEPFLGQIAGPLIATIACLAVWPSTAEGTPEENRDQRRLLVLLLGFLATPAVAWLLGVMTTGVYTPRYALQPLIALSAIFALCLYRFSGRSAGRGLVALAALSLYANVSFARAASKWPAEAEDVATVSKVYRQFSQPGMPLVVSSIEMWLRLNYYGSWCERTSCLYLDDPAESLRYAGEDTNEREIFQIRSLMPASLYAYRPWSAGRQEYLLYVVTNRTMWILPKLLHDSWNIKLLANTANGMLLDIRRPETTVRK